MMEDAVVVRRQWMTHEAFLDLVGATNLIPGPNSTEMAIHIGYLRAGWAGACCRRGIVHPPGSRPVGNHGRALWSGLSMKRREAKAALIMLPFTAALSSSSRTTAVTLAGSATLLKLGVDVSIFGRRKRHEHRIDCCCGDPTCVGHTDDMARRRDCPYIAYHRDKDKGEPCLAGHMWRDTCSTIGQSFLD